MRAGGRPKRTIEQPKIVQNRRQQKAQEKKQNIIQETRKIQIFSEIKDIDEIDDDEMDEHVTINMPKKFPYGEKDSDTIFIRPIYNQRQLKKLDNDYKENKLTQDEDDNDDIVEKIDMNDDDISKHIR